MGRAAYLHLSRSAPSKEMQSKNLHPRAMLAYERVRYLVLLFMTITFLAIVGVCINKFREKVIGEAHSTKKASEMHFPSLLLCPHRNSNLTLSGTKNLTDYYLNRSPIQDHVISIYQKYINNDRLVSLLVVSY